MKKFSINQFLLLVFIAFLGVSCSDDDEVNVDLRDQAVGTYNIEALAISNMGTAVSEKSTLTISKHSTDQNQIILSFDGDTFYGEKIAAATNGFTFDIPAIRLVDADGDAYMLGGSKEVQLGSSKYDGFYDSVNKEIKIGLKAEYENKEYSDYNFTIDIEGER